MKFYVFLINVLLVISLFDIAFVLADGPPPPPPPPGGISCTPITEICDGLDNDCDSSIDEDLSMTQSCSVGSGACISEGDQIRTCISGAWSSWSSCSATPGIPSTEICDMLDNDCDDLINEDIIKAVTCGYGVCAGNTGTMTCSPSGSWIDDTCNPLAGASAELCDGLDNDCDNTIDEGNVCVVATDPDVIPGTGVNNVNNTIPVNNNYNIDDANKINNNIVTVAGLEQDLTDKVSNNFSTNSKPEAVKISETPSKNSLNMPFFSKISEEFSPITIISGLVVLIILIVVSILLIVRGKQSKFDMKSDSKSSSISDSKNITPLHSKSISSISNTSNISSTNPYNQSYSDTSKYKIKNPSLNKFNSSAGLSNVSTSNVSRTSFSNTESRRQLLRFFTPSNNSNYQNTVIPNNNTNNVNNSNRTSKISSGDTFKNNVAPVPRRKIDLPEDTSADNIDDKALIAVKVSAARTAEIFGKHDTEDKQ